MKSVKLAIQGCCHGELDLIYDKLRNCNIDLLIITGDFQALRNSTDLKTISVPEKYKRLGQFHKYYTGVKKAPILTVFVGGNHECSSYLTELRYGGWVAPNIYYLGEFGCIWYKGVRIAGASGIYNYMSFKENRSNDYDLPYTPSTLRSVYHMTPKTYLKMMLMKSELDIDVMISHDWPQYIYHYGDINGLLRQKKFFQEDIQLGKLGSPLLKNILNSVRPLQWFSSHLHVKFKAEVEQIKPPSQEIDIDMDDMDSGGKTTKFLALDKCGRHRKHLEIVDLEVDKNHKSYDDTSLYYDPRSVAVNIVLEEYFESGRPDLDVDKLINGDDKVVEEIRQKVESKLKALENEPLLYRIPENFEIIAPGGYVSPPLKYWPNNQTNEFCVKFGLKPLWQ